MQNERPVGKRIKLGLKWVIILLSGIGVHLLCYTSYLFKSIRIPKELEHQISTILVNWEFWLFLTYFPLFYSLFS
ncbi:MAG: hypothetical protein EAX86_08130 [Candidatus Heimdallarchaeota archaeon]|nr:hypothetical protein [Candidatus Heimdallarchaeota archaeon]